MVVLSVTGIPDYTTLTSHFVHTDFEMAGSVGFSDPNLNGVQHITRYASLSNFQMIPTDCPQRERRGWLGDAQLSAETTIHNFDMVCVCGCVWLCLRVWLCVCVWLCLWLCTTA